MANTARTSSTRRMNCAPSREVHGWYVDNHKTAEQMSTSLSVSPASSSSISTLQDQDGSFSCLPCSSSSTSEANATECKCLGLNRAFQASTIAVRHSLLFPVFYCSLLWVTVIWLLFTALLYLLFFSRSPSFHSLGSGHDAPYPVQIASIRQYRP